MFPFEELERTDELLVVLVTICFSSFTLLHHSFGFKNDSSHKTILDMAHGTKINTKQYVLLLYPFPLCSRERMVCLCK